MSIRISNFYQKKTKINNPTIATKSSFKPLVRIISRSSLQGIYKYSW